MELFHVPTKYGTIAEPPAGYVMPAHLRASSGASDGLLESFLHDMDVLDCQQSKTPPENPASATEKRKLDIPMNLYEPPSSKTNLPSWLKRKRELESLRQQTQAMETRVAYLEMKKSSPDGGLNAFERFKLQSFALEEKQKCIAAQGENKRLKAKLLLYAKQYEVFQEAIALQQKKDACPPQLGQTKMSCPPVCNERDLLDIVEALWGDQTAPFSPLTLSPQLDQQPDSIDLRLLSADEELELKERKPKKKRRRDRNRPWHEMARLQLESDNLELELQTLLANASKQARGALLERNENAQLKAMLQEGMQDVHQLEQNVARQLSELVQTVPNFMAMTTRVLPFDMAVDDAIFKSMAHSVDDQYKDMGRVLRRAGVDGLSSEVVESYVSRTNSVYTGNKVGDMLKFRARTLSPFKKGTLEKALWSGIETGGAVTFEPGQDACDLVVPLGTSSRVAIQKNEVAMDGFTCIMRMVIQQFVENDRVVQVWNTLADWAAGTGCKVRTHEYGWGYIQPLDGNCTVSVGCILMAPTIDGMISSGRCENVKSLTNLYQKMVMSRLQTLENQTMDELVQEQGFIRV